MQVRPANILPTILLFIACLFLTLNLYLLLYPPSVGLSFGWFVAIVVMGLVFAVAGLAVQLRQPKHTEGRGKQRIASASTGLLFLFFLLFAAAELCLIFLVYAVLSFLKVFTG
ncbi:MAG: hypothetical protein AAGC72_09545 [Planctomycetota bacterium]